jgi:lipoprotein-releasing system permease protein
MSRLEFSIAWRYLRSRRGSRLLSLISVIAIAGVVVGVSALIVIMGVMNGLQTDLREKILVGSPDVRVLSYGDDLKIPDWRKVLEKVRLQPGVVAAAPFVITQGGITKNGEYAEGAYVYGLEPAAPGVAEVTTIRSHARTGDFRFVGRDGSQRGVVLGRLLAGRLGAYVGDTVRLVSFNSAKFNPALGGMMPSVHLFEVTGVFETGMYEYDNAYVYVSLNAARDFAGLGDAVTGIEVKTTDRWSAARIAVSLRDALGFPYRTVDWQEQNKSLFQALSLEKVAMGFIVLLIFIVAAFNIVSTLTMVVADKTREIGILKAMGLRAASIRRIFMLQGVFIGVVGTGTGLAVGLTAAFVVDHYKLVPLNPSIYFIDHLPLLTHPLEVALIALTSMTIATVATLYPSAQAAKLFPIEAIRHE